MQRNVIGFTNLPLEIQVLICLNLAPENIAMVALINKFSNKAAMDNNLWKYKTKLHFLSLFTNAPENKNDTIWYNIFRKFYTDDYAPLKKGLRFVSNNDGLLPDVQYNEYSCQKVVSLIKEGALEELKSCPIKINDLLDRKDSNGKSLLYWARKYQHQPILDYFFKLVKIQYLTLNKKINKTKTDEKGLTILHWAIYCNQVKITRKLIERDCNFDAVTKSGLHAIHIACDVGQLEIVDMLLKNKPLLLNQPDSDDSTPLHYAAAADNIDVVSFLLELGANPDQANEDDETVMHQVCQAGNVDMAKLLMMKHPRLLNIKNLDGSTPLVYAALYGQTDTVRFLAEQGADLNLITNSYHYTPLHFSADGEGHAEVVKVLIEYGASPLIVGNNIDDETSDKCCKNSFIKNLIRLEIFIRKFSVGENINNSFLFNLFYDQDSNDPGILDAANVLKSVILGHADSSILDRYQTELRKGKLGVIYSKLEADLPASLKNTIPALQ